MHRQYAHAVPGILAELEQGYEGDETSISQEEAGEAEIMHIYPVEGGGLLFIKTEIPQEKLRQLVVESTPLQTTLRDPRPTQFKASLSLLHFLLLLLLFVGLDSADTALTALFSPTATIIIRPQQQALTTTASFLIGTGKNDIRGRVLPALTLSQTQIVQTTGKGHQDARSATGTLTFFNGQLHSVTISAGTAFSGGNGVQIVTDATTHIPAADPATTPPTFGHVPVPAHAVQPGMTGNIPAFDLNGSCCAASIIVKNLAPFANGHDARDFSYVTRGDIQRAISPLTSLLRRSEQGALSAQLQPGENLTQPTCIRRSSSNLQSGEEAISVQVTVSESCTAIVIHQQSLQARALQLVRLRLPGLNEHYQLAGEFRIAIDSITTQIGRTTLTATIHGTWVYQLNETHIKTLVVGRTGLQAIQLLTKLPGIERVSIASISDNQLLPDDTTHIHLHIIYTAF